MGQALCFCRDHGKSTQNEFNKVALLELEVARVLRRKILPSFHIILILITSCVGVNISPAVQKENEGLFKDGDSFER